MTQFKAAPVAEKKDSSPVLPEIGVETFGSVIFLLVGLAAFFVTAKLFFGFVRRRRRAAIDAILAEEFGPEVSLDAILKAGAQGQPPGE